MIESQHYQPKPDKPLAYNPRLDIDLYRRTDAAEKVRLNPYIKKQLETHVGERLNVLLSTVRYDIRNGHLYGQDSNIPAVEMFANGVGRGGSTAKDLIREQAEFSGFTQIDSDPDFTSINAKTRKKKLVISPPGGSYKHNFYDVFTVKEDEGGKYVEMRRYSSGLDIRQTVAMLKNVELVDESYQANAEYSLSHPIAIDENSPWFKTADDIHKYLHKDHKFASEGDYAQIIKICAPLITSYINTLASNPYDLEGILLNYNALLYTVDLAWDAIKDNDKGFVKDLLLKAAFQYPTQREIRMMGKQPIRQEMIGCGLSGGFNVGRELSSGLEILTSPFSVLDKTTQEDDTLLYLPVLQKTS